MTTRDDTHKNKTSDIKKSDRKTIENNEKNKTNRRIQNTSKQKIKPIIKTKIDQENVKLAKDAHDINRDDTHKNKTSDIKKFDRKANEENKQYRRIIKNTNKQKIKPILKTKINQDNNATINNIEDDLDLVGGGKKKLITYTDVRAARPIAEQLFERAKYMAYATGIAGDYFRRAVYFLIYHEVAAVLRLKQSKLIADLTERSKMSRSGIDNLRVAAETEILFDLDQGRWSVNALVKLYRIKNEEVKKRTVEHMKHDAERFGVYWGETSVGDVADTIAYELDRNIYLSPEQRIKDEKSKLYKEYKSVLIRLNDEDENDDENLLKFQLEMHKKLAEDSANKSFQGDFEKINLWRSEQYNKRFNDRVDFKPTDKELIAHIRKNHSEIWGTKAAYDYVQRRLDEYTIGDIEKFLSFVDSEDEVLQDYGLAIRFFDYGNLKILIKRLKDAFYANKIDRERRNKKLPDKDKANKVKW